MDQIIRSLMTIRVTNISYLAPGCLEREATLPTLSLLAGQERVDLLVVVDGEVMFLTDHGHAHPLLG